MAFFRKTGCSSPQQNRWISASHKSLYCRSTYLQTCNYEHAYTRYAQGGSKKKAAIKESELCMDPGKAKFPTNARQILALLFKDGSLRKYL